MKAPFPRKLFLAVIAGIALCGAVIVLSRLRTPEKHADGVYIQLLREAYDSVTASYVEKPDGKKLVQSMVDGMLAALDPHSAYLPPEPYHEMEVQMSGAFGGVGIELGMRENRLVVIAPIEDTPAFRAGIQANDHIWKIDGTPTRGMSISAAVKRMRGEKGTPVMLAIQRNGSAKPLVYNLIRDIIRIKSLKSKTLEPGYGYIRISQFQERTGSEFRQALTDLHASQPDGVLKGLVVDMRYNPGGVLHAAVEVANCFIGDNASSTVIVSMKGRSRDANHVYNATLGEKEPRYPIVVLMNGGSASASEIVAGALQDHKRAVVMGSQSFGKGSVQSIIPLKGNAALKLTTARYYTPSGRSIQAKGIVPDIKVGTVVPEAPRKEHRSGVTENSLDNRLAPEGDRAGTGDARKGKADAPEKKETAPAHGSREADAVKDYQLRRALELLQSLDSIRGVAGKGG